MVMAGQYAPIFFFLRLWRKKKTLQRALSPLRDAASPLREKRKRRFWQLRKFSALIEGCAGNLMRGRKDVLLFPRFAHGRAYVEKYAVLL